MPDKNLTSFVAWWGAVVATLVLLWDIYKWTKSGPSVVISARPDMKTFVGAPQNLSEKKYILAEAVNKGNKKTTITHLVSYHYSSIVKRNSGFAPGSSTMTCHQTRKNPIWISK